MPMSGVGESVITARVGADATSPSVSGTDTRGTINIRPANDSERPVTWRYASRTAFFIAYEYAGATRDIHLKDPGPPPSDTWMGQSVGRWERETFVVDTTGRADMSQFKVLKSTNELFTQAVKNVLPRMRFSPAMIGGKPVNQLVQQSFQFAVPR